MKRKLLAVLISIALIATVMVPVLGTLASEVETSPAPESSPAAEEEKQTEVDNSRTKQTEVCVGFEEKQTEVDSEEQTQTGEKQDSATVEPQDSEQTDIPSVTEVPADPTTTSTPETSNEPEQTEEVPTDVPAETEIPTAEPTDEPTEEPSPEPSVEPSTEPTEAPELKAGISANQRSAFSGEGISATVHVEGGVAPYNVKVTVSRDGTVLCDNTYVMELSGDLNAAAIADGFGTHTIAAVITDAFGNSMSIAVSIPVAVKEVETRAEWEATIRGVELIGDWREDILTIARTQLGYHESSRNFIVREDGSVQGWTRYGALSGMPYEEWCAMFVTFCMKYAEIPEADYPHFSGCERWLNALDALGAFESRQSGYEPQPGDLIFFNWDEESDADHIGIVESVRDGWVNTIEGNSGRQVRRQSYALNDTQIMGYGNTTKMMDRAGALAEPTPAPTSVPIENVEGRLATINTDSVNLREMPTTESIVLAILSKDTRVTIVGAELYDGETWYRVEREGVQGYVRSDLLTIEESMADEKQEAQDMNGVKPSGDSWQAGQEGVSFVFNVDGAEHYFWQRGRITDAGIAEWEDIPGSNTPNFLCVATLENMKYAYRCVITTADGTVIVSGEATMIDPELVRWMNEVDVDETMLVRALGAKSLESMIFEGNNLVYVRTGEIVAVYNPETTELVDRHYNLTVATVDMESETILPVVSEASEQE